MAKAPNHDGNVPAANNGRAESDDIDLLEYWRILIERRNVVLTCLAVSVAVILLFSFMATPKYQASTTLQIERQGPEILTFQDILGVDPAGYKDYYQTQYKILQSKTVLRLAAERLDLIHNPEFQSRKGTPVGRLYKWVRSFISGPPEDDDAWDKAIEFVENHLTIQPVRNSHLVRISFMDRDAQLAADLANSVADAYQQFSREARFTTTEVASDFLTKQVARLQGEIAELERQLQEYGSEKELLALSDGTQDISEQALADINARLSQARARFATTRARYESVQDTSPDSLPEVLNSQLINSLKQEYAGLERRHTQMTERFKTGWPALREVREELDQAAARLEAETDSIVLKVQESARNDYEQAQAEVMHLEEQVALQKQVVKRVNRDAIEYAGLRAEIETRRNVLSDLVARQSQTQASEQLHDTTASNIWVVDRADVPDRPARPRKSLNLLVALLFGSGFGIGMAFLLHHLDNTIKSAQDIERYAPGVALLGHIPLLLQLQVVYGKKRNSRATEAAATKPNPDFASHTDSRSGYAEAFKNLRTSLLLASPDHPPRWLTVTSCEPSDGKTTITINLAVVLAQMGRQVLLVDADLRRPRLYRAFGLPKEFGLSSVLSGNASVEEVIQETEIPNLKMITSGPIPPNPSELLDSPGLAEFLEKADDLGFEHVLFDCPPAIQVADSLILSTRTDATILVIRAGSTTRDSLTQGTARLRQARAHLAGAILNAVPERSRYYYYRRSKYYRKYYGDASETQESPHSDPAPEENEPRVGAGQGRVS